MLKYANFQTHSEHLPHAQDSWGLAGHKQIVLYSVCA